MLFLGGQAALLISIARGAADPPCNLQRHLAARRLLSRRSPLFVVRFCLVSKHKQNADVQKLAKLVGRFCETPCD